MNNNEKIISSPSRYFLRPQEIVDYPNINNHEKIKALLNWRDSLVQLYQSEQEGMLSKNKNIKMSGIDHALADLEKEKSKMLKCL